jgi:hypothetical protein
MEAWRPQFHRSENHNLPHILIEQHRSATPQKRSGHGLSNPVNTKISRRRYHCIEKDSTGYLHRILAGLPPSTTSRMRSGHGLSNPVEKKT